MGTGDALQWKSNTLLGKLIRLFARPTKDKIDKAGYNVNHTSLIITFDEYDQHRRYTTEALEMGIDLNLLSRRLKTFKGEVWWFPLKLKYNHIRKAIGKIALSYMGIWYDYSSLMKQTHSRVKINDKQLFCSEYYAFCVKKAMGLYTMTDLDNLAVAPRPCDIPDLGIFGKPTKIK